MQTNHIRSNKNITLTQKHWFEEIYERKLILGENVLQMFQLFKEQKQREIAEALQSVRVAATFTLIGSHGQNV